MSAIPLTDKDVEMLKTAVMDVVRFWAKQVATKSNTENRAQLDAWGILLSKLEGL